MGVDVERLGKFIQSRRRELGMTQGELGAKLKVTDKAISRWERGVGFPDINLLEPLAEALQVSIEELMRCEQINPGSRAGQSAAAPEVKHRKYRRFFAMLCMVFYSAFSVLVKQPQYADRLYWMNPLSRLLFLLTVAAFLYASWQEVDYGKA